MLGDNLHEITVFAGKNKKIYFKMSFAVILPCTVSEHVHFIACEVSIKWWLNRNNSEPDQTVPIWIYTVCSDMFIQNVE